MQRIGVIGAGTMGHGIAQVSAMAGYTVVLTDADPPAPPCGLCRETLAEFCGPDLEIRLVGRGDAHRDFRLGELFPEPFRFEPRN